MRSVEALGNVLHDRGPASPIIWTASSLDRGIAVAVRSKPCLSLRMPSSDVVEHEAPTKAIRSQSIPTSCSPTMNQLPAIIVVCVAVALFLLFVVLPCPRTRPSPELPLNRGHVRDTVAYTPVQGHPLQQTIQSAQNGMIAHAQSSHHLGRYVLLVQDSIAYARDIALSRRINAARTANDRTSTDTSNQIVTPPARASRHPKGRRYGDRPVPATRLGRIPAIASSSGGVPGSPCSVDTNLNQDHIARFRILPPGSMGPGAVCLGAKAPHSASRLDTHILDIGVAH